MASTYDKEMNEGIKNMNKCIIDIRFYQHFTFVLIVLTLLVVLFK